MSHPDLITLCVELQCRGVRIVAAHTGRSGGAGPSEGQTIIIGGRYLNVPTASWYVASSPYRIEKYDGRWSLFHATSYIQDIFFPSQPAFYNELSPSGLPFKHLALLHGCDCFASTIYQDCLYWNTPNQCRFCGIGLSLKNNTTILTKDPVDLACAAAFAAQHDGVRHVTLTTGAWHDELQGFEHLCACVRDIKKSAALPVHVQLHPPQNMQAFDQLKAVGVDTVGIHIEVGNTDLLSTMTPGKSALGIATYETCWEHGVSVFGKNQVSSFLLAGLGETSQQLTDMVECIARLGVFPYILPLRPIPGTLLSDWRPPEPSYMMGLYTQTARILKKYGLESRKSKAGCVRCGACSSLSLFEEDAVS